MFEFIKLPNKCTYPFYKIFVCCLSCCFPNWTNKFENSRKISQMEYQQKKSQEIDRELYGIENQVIETAKENQQENDDENDTKLSDISRFTPHQEIDATMTDSPIFALGSIVSSTAATIGTIGTTATMTVTVPATTATTATEVTSDSNIANHGGSVSDDIHDLYAVTQTRRNGGVHIAAGDEDTCTMPQIPK